MLEYIFEYNSITISIRGDSVYACAVRVANALDINVYQLQFIRLGEYHA